MEEFVIKSKLVERGWTDALVTKFLPEPDQTKSNPRYRSAAPMKLYLKERVEKIEATEQFKEAKEKSGSRRLSAQKAVESKMAKTMEYVDKAVKVKVPRMSQEQLVARACRHYNDWNIGRDNWSGNLATKDSDVLFLHRICVNFLRHEMTEYDDHLDEVRGKVGTGDAYLAIRKKVFDVIAEVYPWLASECKRQQGEE